MMPQINRRAATVAAAGALVLLGAVDGAYVLGKGDGRDAEIGVRSQVIQAEVSARSSAVAAASTSAVRAYRGLLEIDHLPAGVDRDAARRAEAAEAAFAYPVEGCVIVRMPWGYPLAIPVGISELGGVTERNCPAVDPDGQVYGGSGKRLPGLPEPSRVERWRASASVGKFYVYRNGSTFAADINRCDRYAAPVTPPPSGVAVPVTAPDADPASVAYCAGPKTTQAAPTTAPPR